MKIRLRINNILQEGLNNSTKLAKKINIKEVHSRIFEFYQNAEKRLAGS